jgi:hypothetical protein
MTGERPTAGEPRDAAREGRSDVGTAPFACPYCGREFARPDYRDLHLGLEHADALSPAERSAYESARDAEEEALTLFRYKALGLLIVIYFGFLMLYAVSL